MLGLVIAAGGTHARALDCLQAARDTEQQSGLPTGLLAAIGQVESGGWGWSVNGNGSAPGHRFDSAEAAERYAGSLIDAGQRMVDLGCFQIDLLYHPDAFATWQDAFDSRRNAQAAADILNQLYRRTGDWRQAIALYHSADPARGTPYLRSVLAAWKGGAPEGLPPLPAEDPYVIVVAPMTARRTNGWGLIPAVWMPTGQARPGRRRGGLPQVITP